jgi:hypothetical protein
MKKVYLYTASLCISGLLNFSSAFASEEDTAKDMAALFSAGRAVISDNQDQINNSDLGDKGLTGDVVIAKAKEKYKEKMGKDVDAESPYQKAILEAIGDVMNDAQPVINEKGKGFKGFLPAVFAGQVANKASEKLAGKAVIKLTAPKELVRNRKNRPDEWESRAIEETFKKADYEKGKVFSETTTVNGKDAFRFIQPEYYKQSCLSCHGGPKGETDITGGKKEGANLDDLGGAVSVTIFK